MGWKNKSRRKNGNLHILNNKSHTFYYELKCTTWSKQQTISPSPHQKREEGEGKYANNESWSKIKTTIVSASAILHYEKNSHTNRTETSLTPGTKIKVSHIQCTCLWVDENMHNTITALSTYYITLSLCNYISCNHYRPNWPGKNIPHILV